MADKLGIGCDVRELKLGASFTNNKSSAYHTIKYDFKPASVDVNKMATVDVGTNNQVTVTVPHLDGAGVPHTVFKGNQRSYSKECVLIIDRVTGQITLEKLSSNIQVKKTRQETNQRPALGNGVPKAPPSAIPADIANVTQRSTSRTRVASGISRRNNGSSNASGSSSKYGPPTHSTPPNLLRSPPRVRTSPPQAAPWSGGQSTLASLPMIGLDDNVLPHAAALPSPVPPTPPMQNGFCNTMTNLDLHSETMLQVPEENNNRGAVQEDASSSSSSSGSDSDSDQSNSASDSEPDNVPVKPLSNGVSNSDAPPPSFVNDVLNNDLRLSESESDSD